MMHRNRGSQSREVLSYALKLQTIDYSIKRSDFHSNTLFVGNSLDALWTRTNSLAPGAAATEMVSDTECK